MSPEIVKSSFLMKAKSISIGDFESRKLNLNDLIFIEEKIAEIKDDREFTYKLLHHQINTPPIPLDKFEKTPDEELREIARSLINQEKDTFKYFVETSDQEFYGNFRKAIQKHLEEQHKRIQESFTPVKGILENFAKSYSDIIGKLQSSISPVSRLVRETSQLNRLFRDAQFSFSLYESIKPAIQQYQFVASIIEKALKPQINFWQEWTHKNRKLFEGFDSYWKSFHDKYNISEQQAIEILKKYKWFVSPSLPIAFVFEAVRIGRQKGNHRGEINRLFVEYFRSNNYEELYALVNNWESNEVFKPRMKILKDCICGLKYAKKEYNPSNFVLPALIAQIDGIQQKYMEKNGLSFDIKKRRWKDSTGQEIDWKKWYRSRTTNQDMDNLANEIFLNILFQASQHGIALQVPFAFNRHKILHGENFRYGRIDNVIRAFLILDFLASLK